MDFQIITITYQIRYSVTPKLLAAFTSKIVFLDNVKRLLGIFLEKMSFKALELVHCIERQTDYHVPTVTSWAKSYLTK